MHCFHSHSHVCQSLPGLINIANARPSHKLGSHLKELLQHSKKPLFCEQSRYFLFLLSLSALIFQTSDPCYFPCLAAHSSRNSWSSWDEVCQITRPSWGPRYTAKWSPRKFPNRAIYEYCVRRKPLSSESLEIRTGTVMFKIR